MDTGQWVVSQLKILLGLSYDISCRVFPVSVNHRMFLLYLYLWLYTIFWMLTSGYSLTSLYLWLHTTKKILLSFPVTVYKYNTIFNAQSLPATVYHRIFLLSPYLLLYTTQYFMLSLYLLLYTKGYFWWINICVCIPNNIFSWVFTCNCIPQDISAESSSVSAYHTILPNKSLSVTV